MLASKKIVTLVVAVFLVGVCHAKQNPGPQADFVDAELTRKYSTGFLEEVILEPQDWVPYPRSNQADEWRGLLPPAKYDAVIKNAEQYLGFGWPVGKVSVFLEYVQDGNRSRYQNVHFARRTALVALVMGELVEGKSRFLNDIINGVWAISEETFWGVPAHLSLQESGIGLADVNDPVVDLFAAQTAQILAWTSYLLGDSLDRVHPKLRERIYLEIDRRVFKVIESRPAYRWTGSVRKVDDPTLSYARRSFLERRPNNWNPWINSNLLTSILLLEKDKKRRAEFVHQVFAYLDNYLEPHPTDGGSDEGTSYWGHAAGSTFDSFDLVSMATQGAFDEFDQQLIRNMGVFITKAYIGNGYFVNFADASPRPHHSPMLVYRFGKAIGSSEMKEMGAYLAGQAGFEEAVPQGRSLLRNLPELLYTRELLGNDVAEPLLADSWLPDIQLMTSRDKPGSVQGLYLAAKAGHNEESHNHNDVGSFIVYKNGYPGIIDIGGATYTRNYGNEWVRDSAFHNLLPVIGGNVQRKGRKYSAQNVSYHQSEGEVMFSQDFAAAYGEESGLRTWERTYIHRKGDSISISDRYEFDALPESLILPMMFVLPPDIFTPGKVIVKSADMTSLTLSYDVDQLDCTVEKIDVDDRSVSAKWGDTLYRINFKVRKPTRSGQFSFLIE